MKSQARATLSFSAGHTLADNPWCGRQTHGHRWTVTCTWDREGYPTTDHAAWCEHRQKMLDLVLELKDRDLDKMLGAQVPNAFGIAAFFMERLVITTPIRTVEVHEDDPSGPIAIIEHDTDY